MILALLLLSTSLGYSQTPATAVPLMLPSAIVYDAQGNLYIAETGNSVIRKVDVAGMITTIAGTGTQGFSGDNGPATAARLDSPQGLALGANHLYIADTHNNRVRSLDLTTGVITTIAGSSAGFSGDNAPATAARLNLPTALAIDANNNLYIADTQNYRVRKITAATGIITTVAGDGTQGFSGDSGPATAASIDSSTGVAIDAAGNLYISDTHNHRIRKVAAVTGIITTVAGTGFPGYSGDDASAIAATLDLPHGLGIDSAGNLYIADTANHRIRRIDVITGAITTIAGDGIQGFSGNSGPATAAPLDTPRAATLSPAGLITFADTANRRVLQIDAQPAPAIHTIAGLAAITGSTLHLAAPSTLLYGTGQLIATLASTTTATGPLTFTLLNTSITAAAPLTANTAAFDTSALPAGPYTLIATYAGDPTHPSTQSQPLSFRIMPRPIAAIPDPITLLYGQPIPALTGALTGALPQDDGSLTASFTAPITASSPAAAYPISAFIAGSAAKNYTLATSPASVTINPAPTVVTLNPSATSITSGAPLTVAVRIASTTTGTPTGPVTLMDGATVLQSVDSSAGNATFTLSALNPGSHSLTIDYAGDRNFIPSASAPAFITVISAPATPVEFTLTPTGTATQTIPSGGTANFNFALQIQGSTLASPITLAATGLPPLATASFNPAYLPPGTTPNTFILTINTPQTTAMHRGFSDSSLLLAFLLLPITGVAFGRRTCRNTTLVFAILVSTLTLCSGCGSRINLGDQAATAVKSYTITVTGTATSPTGGILQHSATVDLLIHSIN